MMISATKSQTAVWEWLVLKITLKLSYEPKTVIPAPRSKIATKDKK